MQQSWHENSSFAHKSKSKSKLQNFILKKTTPTPRRNKKWKRSSIDFNEHFNGRNNSRLDAFDDDVGGDDDVNWTEGEMKSTCLDLVLDNDCNIEIDHVCT